MFDCSKEIRSFHDEAVTLPKAEQDKLRGHRDANQDRLKKGLEKNEDPAPEKFIKQGSYAMRTMVQHPKNDYDIDDGVVFQREDLKGPQGGDKSALDSKKMACRALQDDKFNEQPKVLKNCVRVYYNAGYHIDVPVYRQEKDQVDTCYELASTDWKKTDPEGVTKWFDERLRLRKIFADIDNQMRRMVRYLKAFAKSRGDSWNMPSGFILTILCDEKFWPAGSNDDKALYDLFRSIKSRLALDLTVKDPVMPGEYVTHETEDANMVTLREKLDWAITQLQVLDDPGCTRKAALRAWKKVFNTDFFDQYIKEDEESEDKSSNGIASSIPTVAVDKQGRGNFAIRSSC